MRRHNVQFLTRGRSEKDKRTNGNVANDEINNHKAKKILSSLGWYMKAVQGFFVAQKPSLDDDVINVYNDSKSER